MSSKSTAGRGIKHKRISSDYHNVEDIKCKGKLSAIQSCNMAKGKQTHIFVFFLNCPAVVGISFILDIKRLDVRTLTQNYQIIW